MYHEDVMKEVNVKKNQTLTELILLCYEAFGIEGKEVNEGRLRAYDAVMKVRLGVFDLYEAKLLELASFKGITTLDLEFKDEEGKFEEYDDKCLWLRVVKYEEGLNYDWSKPDSFPSINIKVFPKTEKVNQLEDTVAEALGIPVANLIIFLRNEHGYNSTVSTEYYNIEWRRNRIISEVSKTLTHGKVLFCE